MLPELPESVADGEIAAIYEELKTLCAIPYVSSMQRHLATRPGWLEWAWAAVAPAFRSHVAQSAAWGAVEDDDLSLPALPKLNRTRLRQLGVSEQGAAAIGNVCMSFIRVSPTNLMFSGLVRGLLEPTGVASAPWDGPRSTPPSMLPSLPAMVSIETLSGPVQASVRAAFEVEVAGAPFVPGLYRMLAQWPGFLHHLAVVLGPRMTEPQTVRTCARLCARIDAVVPLVSATLPPPPPPPEPGAARDVVAAIERYRITSPQMVVYCRLIAASINGL